MVTARLVVEVCGCHPSTARRWLRLAGAVVVDGQLVLPDEAWDGWRANRAAELLARHGYDPGLIAPHLVAATREWVTAEEAGRLLRRRLTDVIAAGRGCPVMGLGLRGDPKRYRLTDLRAMLASNRLPRSSRVACHGV